MAGKNYRVKDAYDTKKEIVKMSKYLQYTVQQCYVWSTVFLTSLYKP